MSLLLTSPSEDTRLPISPYLVPDFYTDALAKGRHRDIVGGRWEETGRLQMSLLMNAGLMPYHHFLDLGAGSLRLGCKLVPYLEPGHYWGTDASGDLMRRGRETELADPARLPEDHLIEDADFGFPGVPDTITHVMAFAVFTHLPLDWLGRALAQVHSRFLSLEAMYFTVFLAPDAQSVSATVRQADGVVTHPARAPYHFLEEDVDQLACASGFIPERCQVMLPRGQALWSLVRA